MYKKIVTIFLLSFPFSLSIPAALAAGGTVTGLNTPGYSGVLEQIIPKSAISQYDGSFTLAVQFIRSSGLHKSLSLLLLDSVKTDDLVEEAISQHGFSSVKKSVVLNIQNTTNHYRQEWISLLASIYSNQFQENVLQSILQEGENSPYYPDFISRQNEMNTSKLVMIGRVLNEARASLLENLKDSFSG